MSSDAPPASTHATGTRAGRSRADPRLPGYLIAGLGTLIASVATGQHELAALGAPFLALAAMGLVDRQAVETTGQVTLQHDLVIEDDIVKGQISVDWEGEAEVEFMLAGWKGVSPQEPNPGVRWSPPERRGPVNVPFQLKAQSWGIHDLGSLWVQVRRPGSLVYWERKVASAPTIRVLPSPLRLQQLLRPTEPRAVSGMHLSRSRGHGTDFAELRPYQSGDRLRDLSWSTSARLGAPWVTVHHPERTGTVILLLDVFFSSEEAGPESLARAARAAWAVASVHLSAQDRVGLMARGRTAAWVPPQGGLRARWLLMDALLSVGGAAEDVWRRRRGARPVVPADALIVGVTTLRTESFLQDLVHHRRTGHRVGALVIDTSDLMPDPERPADAVARRVWHANRDAKVHSLERSGVSTALITESAGVGPAVSALRRQMRAGRRAQVGA